VQFLQSFRDFPQMIKLGDKTPSFGFNRFKQGLRFIPVDDEGFTLRSNRQQLLYKGRRRSHRFTILGDGYFEYDCILLKEPDSNIIKLRIEGGDKYDFFRQPDFVENPFLKGSYAVYKKQTLIGEGTGKLCHIHRPEIIDARGRRCWGSLAVVGNELRIIVPEKWLSEASYPVIVDPTVGTTTTGALNTLPHPMYQTFYIYFSREIAVEQFMLPANFRGQATAYFYSNIYNSNISNVSPVMYSMNNNLPDIKLSSNEGIINSRTPNTLNFGWQSTVFSVNDLLASGTWVWFGLYAELLYPRCDYGGSLIPLYSKNREIFNNFPVNNIDYNDIRLNLKVSMYFNFEAVAGSNYNKTLVETASIYEGKNINLGYNRKCTETSRVLTTISKAQSFFRHCVNTAHNSMMINSSRFIKKLCSVFEIVLTDTRLYIKIEYNRKCTQTIKVLTAISKAQTFFRHCVLTAGINMSLNGAKVFDYICSAVDEIVTNTRLYIKIEYNRKCTQAINAITTISKAQTFLRTCILSAGNSMSINGKKIIAKIGSVADKIATETKLYIQVEYMRKCTQTMKVKTYISKTQSFFRRCKFTAGNSMWLNGIGKNKLVFSLIEKIIANSRLIATKGISRKINDSVNAEGIVKRKLSVLLRIMTNAVVRSFINKRFLKATVEITLKSRIGEIK